MRVSTQGLAARVPTFLSRPDVPMCGRACFSCGDSLPEPLFSRCGRCSLAWRLACRVTVSTEVAEAMDAARVAYLKSLPIQDSWKVSR
jgi:hypothetical protein